jgi:dTDP-glucose pyrophosphorylase
MRPIAHTSAKQLVPVAGKPVLFYELEAIAAAGITDVGVIVGDTAGEIAAASATDRGSACTSRTSTRDSRWGRPMRWPWPGTSSPPTTS